MKKKIIKTIYENIISILAGIFLFLIYQSIEKNNKLKEKHAQFLQVNCYTKSNIEGKEKINLEFNLIEAVLDIKRKCAYPDGKPDEKDKIKKVELVAKITSSKMNGQKVHISTLCDDINLDGFNKYTYIGTFEGVVKNDKLVGKMKAVGKILRVQKMATEPMNLLK